MLGIRQAYTTSTRALDFGIQGYHVENKYFDPKNESYSAKKSLKREQTKKGSYLDDYVAIHGKIPGPGVYDFSVKGSVYDTTKSRKVEYPDKKTIFDEMCDKQLKEKFPAPGHYQLSQKKRPQSASSRRPKVADRSSFLDGVQYQSSVTPGVGAYNPRPQSANVKRIDRMKPEDWVKKHQQESKNSSKKIKQPTPFSYNPTKIEKKSFSKFRKGWTTWGCIDRFKDSKTNTNVGPGKYIAHSQWGKSINFGSQGNIGSVYYK